VNSRREQLDATVVNIELTLGSIIQAVALTFLAESASSELAVRRWSGLLYLSAGLFIIFIFWSRSVIHTLTLIRWPIEFGHNFLYIACAVGESILFARLGRPLAWFELSAIYAALVWLLFIYDLRLVRARLAEAADEIAREIYGRTLRDQWRNIALFIPLLFLFNLGAALAIRGHPAFFIARDGHLLVIAAQLVCFALYLLYVVRFFSKIAPLLARD